MYVYSIYISKGAISRFLSAEFFTSEARGKAISIAIFINWFSAFLTSVSFPFLEEALGNYTFLIFAGIQVVFAIFIMLFMPETKNKSIDEIVSMFNKKLIFSPRGY